MGGFTSCYLSVRCSEGFWKTKMFESLIQV